MTQKDFHLPVTTDKASAVDLIETVCGLSRSEIKQTMQKGAVWLEDDTGTRRLRRVKSQLSVGATLHVYHDSDVLAQTIPAPTLIDDCEAYSIWFKPSGVLSQGSKWGDHCTIHRWIETHDDRQRPAFIIHRLDRAACGLMIIAHGKSVAGQLGKLFETRVIEKIYRTRVPGRFEAGLPLAIEKPVNGKPASTTVLAIHYDDAHEHSILTLRIDSGRKHQIRQHLAGMGYPIVGDRLYGSDTGEDLQLCACSLTFECPIEHRPRGYQVPPDLIPEGLQ